MDSTSTNRWTTQRINWRKGTLWPYESMAGIGAKFCFVNRVSPRLFRDYLKTLGPNFKSADFLFLADRPQTDIVKFAIDLGEPLAKVRELRVGRFYPPSGYFHGRSLGSWPPNSRFGVPVQWHWDVSYCPVCVRHGFHASFHQINMFSRCLVHGEKLKEFEAKRSYWNYRRPDERFIADVYELFFEGESKWDYRRPDDWFLHHEIQNIKTIKGYLSLVDETCQKGEHLENHFVAGSYQLTRINRLDVLYFHHWPTKIPRILKRVFPQKLGSATLSTKEFLNPGLLKGDNISLLVEAQRHWALLLEENTTWLRFATKAINEMMSGKNSHQVGNGSFRHFKPIDQKEELQQEWLTPYYQKSRSRHERFSDVMSWYVQIGNTLEARGLAKKVPVDFNCAWDDKAPRLFHQEAYQIDETLKELTDIVLRAKFLDDIWNTWKLVDQTEERKQNLPDYETVWCVLVVPPNKLELRLWSRTPSFLPTWNRINSDQHSNGT